MEDRTNRPRPDRSAFRSSCRYRIVASWAAFLHAARQVRCCRSEIGYRIPTTLPRGEHCVEFLIIISTRVRDVFGPHVYAGDEVGFQ